MSFIQLQKQEFIKRHIGPNPTETAEMLESIGCDSLESLVSQTVPAGIRMQQPLQLEDGMSEHEYLEHVKNVSLKNKLFKTYIGQGYYDTLTPSVILRNIFENPGWYTQYTPYQAEIAQGRLESLLNYQTMVCDLTGLPIANASLLDEATAVAEAMNLFFHAANKDAANPTKPKFFVDKNTFTQTQNVVVTRALPLGIQVVVADFATTILDETYFGACIQYPNAQGTVQDYQNFINAAHDVNAYVVMATDLLALTVLKSPGELNADVACGNAQRFGVPLGYGGPHAAFLQPKMNSKEIYRVA